MSESEAGLAALQEILLRGERQRLEELDRKIERTSRDADVEAVAQVLPAALRQGREQGKALELALAPTIESVLEESVRRRPQKLADALFPIFGPAIRAAIANAIRGMVQSLNQVLEHSFSLRGLRWRLEAWRTGVPFAEVVLLHSLVYRVEEVFLIHAETGLLLCRVHGVDALEESDAARAGDGGLRESDAGVVSGMLTAIQDFVRDSFAARPGETLERFRVGEREVLVASGAGANLAVVVRGEPPAALADTARAVLAEVHGEFGPALADFQGDAEAFAACRPLLELCIEEQYEAPATSPLTWLLLLLPFLLMGLLVGLRVWEGLARRDLVEALRAEPGIEAVTADSPWVGWPPWERWGAWSVAGVRDPLARAPREVLAELPRAPREPRWDFALMAGCEAEFVLRRARRLLEPPATVELAYEGADGAGADPVRGVLRVSGRATAEWAAEARRWGGAVAGVERVDCRALEVVPAAAELQRRIEAVVVPFAVDEARLTAESAALVEQLAETLRAWREALAVEGYRGGRVAVLGSADATGTPLRNRELSRGRAEALAAALRARGITVDAVSGTEMGSGTEIGRGAVVRLQPLLESATESGSGAR